MRSTPGSPPEQPEPPADPFGYDAVLVLGGAMNVDQEDSHGWLAGEKALLAELLERDRPLLGLCLGGQLRRRSGRGAAAPGDRGRRSAGTRSS